MQAVDIKLLGALNRDDLKKLCGDNYPEWISFPVYEQVYLTTDTIYIICLLNNLLWYLLLLLMRAFILFYLFLIKIICAADCGIAGIRWHDGDFWLIRWRYGCSNMLSCCQG